MREDPKAPSHRVRSAARRCFSVLKRNGKFVGVKTYEELERLHPTKFELLNELVIETCEALILSGGSL